MDRDTNRTAAENPASDAELAERARGAGPEADAAFAVLHNRHHGAALRHARRLEPDADAAEDLVSDAFVEVLAQLRRGGGPRESFRAYLCATMRHSHAERAQARRTVVPTDEATLDALGGTAPQTAEALPDLLLVKQAFGSLPDRWQAVLWHTEVEGEKPRHIARLLGMTPNAVSQLAVRAREGLREAFLTAHIGRLPERCRSRGEQLGGYVRGTLRIRDRRAVDDHLADCPTCARLCAELAATNAHLRVLLLPAILGGTATAALTAEALAGGAAAGGTGALSTGSLGTGSLGTGSVGTGNVGVGAGPTGVGPAATAPAGSSVGTTAGTSTGTSAGSGLGPAPAAPAPGGAPAGSGPPNALGKVAQSAVRKAVLAGTVAAATAATLALAVVLPGDAKPTAAAEKQADQITEPGVPPVRPPGPAQPPAATQPPGPPAVPSAPRRTPPNTRPPVRPESTPTVPGTPPAVPPPDDSVTSTTPPAPPATGSPTPTAPSSPSPTTAATPSEPITTTPPPSPTTAPPSPTPPVAAMAVDDSATVPAGGSVSLNLLANDRGEGLRIVGSSVAWSLYGRISCDRQTGACTYQTWTPLLTGTDVFHYTVRDTNGNYSSATIRITVLPPTRT